MESRLRSSASSSGGLFTPAALRVCSTLASLGKKKKYSHAFMHTEHSECIVSVYCRESQLLGRFAGTNILPPPAPPGVPWLLLCLLEASWFNADWHICSLCMRLLFIHLFIDLLRYFLPNQTSHAERCTFEAPPTAVQAPFISSVCKQRPGVSLAPPAPDTRPPHPPPPAPPLPRLLFLFPAIFPSPPLYSRSSLSFFRLNGMWRAGK